MHYTVGTVPPPCAAAPHAAALGPGAHQCAAALGKMHDDRPSLNGVRTIMHLAKYETLRRRRNSIYADRYSWPGFEACRIIRLGSASAASPPCRGSS